MLILGTKLCPDCVRAEETLQEKGIAYDYLDSTESIGNLKKFLKFRDNHSEFDEIKAKGQVGVPCFVFSKEELTFDLDEAIKRVEQENK